MDFKFTTKPYLPTLVVSVILLFIAVFLPWATAGGIGGGYATGTQDWGAMTTIASIIGIALSFLDAKQIRALGLICVGLLALVGAIIYMTRLNGITVGFGLILEVLASLLAIFIGYTDYRQPGQSNPPAPPPQQ